MTTPPPPPPTGLSATELAHRARAIAWLLLDVDGVMTDGRLYYTDEGETMKTFHARDGLGIKMAQWAGIKVGILSGRKSGALAQRANELWIDELIQGRDDKGPAFDRFLERRDVTPDRVAYVGDDVQDLPVIERVALSFAPADAVEAVRRRVDRVLAAAGGAGAVREVVELLLAARAEDGGAGSTAGSATPAGEAGAT